MSLLILVAAIYYGVNLGRLWFRYWEIQDRMDTMARFGANQTVDQITRQLQADAESIGLPKDARDFRIVKADSPAAITISIVYAERVDLPLLHRTFVFRPVATHKL